MNKLSQKRLVDTMIEAYMAWREACLQVNEERAAQAYAHLVRAANEFVSGEAAPAEPFGGAPRELGFPAGHCSRE